MTASTPSQVGGLNTCLNAQGFFITASVPDKSTSMTGTDTAEITANIKGAGYEYTRVGQFQLDSQGTSYGWEKLCLRFPDKDDATDVETDNLVSPAGSHCRKTVNRGGRVHPHGTWSLMMTRNHC